MRTKRLSLMVIALLAAVFVVSFATRLVAQEVVQKRLQQLLKRFPEADLNGDGSLTVEEALQFRQQNLSRKGGLPDVEANEAGPLGAPRQFQVHAGWEKGEFPADAICYKSPDEIRKIYQQQVKKGESAVVSFQKPNDGGLRVVGTGHSFMAPGYRTLPLICKADGISQPLYTHTGGGITGSARYKWEQENGIFDFDGKPTPKLLASIANAQWDAMMWGPYFNDRPEYYLCWIDFCLKYNPEMKFYLSDAWPQLAQLKEVPKSEAEFTEELFDQLGKERMVENLKLIEELRNDGTEHVYVVPTSNAMVLAAKHYLRGELPGIEGVHRVVGNQERSLWRDALGHLGPGMDRLEGYVFYSTLYGKSPELITETIRFTEEKSFPNAQLDRMFRKIAWQAVVEHPYSGVTDNNHDGLNDLE